MFDYFGMAYKDSDCTVVITMMLGGGDTSAFVVPSAAIASTVLQRPHKDSDHTAIIAVVH